MNKNNYWKEIKRLLSYMEKGRYGFIGLSLLSALLFTSNKVLMSLANRDLINAATERDYQLLYEASGYAVTAFILLVIIDPLVRYIKDKIAIHGMRSLRLALFDHIERLPMKYFDDHHSGDLIARASGDMNKVNAMWYGQLRSLLVSFLHGMGAIVTLLFLDWRLSILVTGMGLLTAKINVALAKPMGIISQRVQQHTSNSTQRFLDIIHGARVIKLFHLEDQMGQRFSEENALAAHESMKRVKRNAVMESASFLLTALHLLGVLVIGLVMVREGLIDMGSVVAAITLQGGITTMFLSLGTWLARMQVSLASARRVFEIMDEPTEANPEAEISIDLQEGDVSVELEQVSFGYDNSSFVLEGLHLKAMGHQTTALVGASGGGKSTIVKLLLGLYAPASGHIRIGGKPIQEFGTRQLRKMIAYVPQEAYLFDGTILDNIKCGRENASPEQVIEAAKAANAHDFIIGLPGAYQAEVGEGGSRLSGGQKQRIALARAILKDAPILLLDEATASLDSDNEQLIQAALNSYAKTRTTIVIAHRLSTIEGADKICVIEKGRVVEEGKHIELINLEKHYNRLYHQQYAKDKMAG